MNSFGIMWLKFYDNISEFCFVEKDEIFFENILWKWWMFLFMLGKKILRTEKKYDLVNNFEKIDKNFKIIH